MLAATSIAIRKPEIAYPADGSVVPVTRTVWKPVEIALPTGNKAHSLAGKRIVVLGGDEKTSRQIARTLEGLGASVTLFSQNSNPGELPGNVDGIIDLNVGGDFSPKRGADWQAAMRQTVSLLKAVYLDWVTETDARRLFYMPVTRLGGTMGFGESGQESRQPLGGIWAGLAKTLPREIPNCNIRILDVAETDYNNLDRIIANELYDWGLFEVGYRQGRRYTLYATREDAADPDISLDTGDTILISGGGRGIGFALALSLCRTFGCRVVVTGRRSLPSGAEPWLNMDEAAFKSYQQGLFKSIPAGKTIGGVRREVEAMKIQRELFRHMREAEQEGLRLEYTTCDFTSLEEVEKLVASLEPGLSGIIHNAGIDTPVRLPSKTADAFINTINTKIGGFINLFQVARAKNLKFFCNVGSLTGRWGGMVGQLDYASANEGLSRIGLWAATKVSYPLKTLCWPTWNRLGMIANFEATLKYMGAVEVEEGVYHWERELLSGGSGEITFMGPVGPSLTPVLMRGFPVISEVPEAERLYSQLFFAGEATEFSIFHSIKSFSQIDLATTPALRDFQISGRPALPIGLMLELALSTGEWVAPEGWPELYLHEVRDIKVNLSALALESENVILEKEGKGQWENGRWVVDITINRINAREKQEVIKLRLDYRKEALATKNLTLSFLETGLVEIAATNGSFRWAGHLIKLARWQKSAGEGLYGEVSAAVETDLWSYPYLPRLALPLSGLENIFRAVMAQSKSEANILLVADLKFYNHNENRSLHRLVSNTAGTSWAIAGKGGELLVEVEGLKYA